MWAIIKFDHKKLLFLEKELSDKLGNDIEFYKPKMLIRKFYNNKKVVKEINLLGDYMFCFHKNLSKKNLINSLSYTKGLKYFLKGFKESQKEIISFIKKSKKAENKDGYLSREFYDLCVYKSYKINTGPFSDIVFKIINLQNNKIKALIGNMETTISSKNLMFSPS